MTAEISLTRLKNRSEFREENKLRRTDVGLFDNLCYKQGHLLALTLESLGGFDDWRPESILNEVNPRDWSRGVRLVRAD
jgi:hypothetical protein